MDNCRCYGHLSIYFPLTVCQLGVHIDSGQKCPRYLDLDIKILNDFNHFRGHCQRGVVEEPLNQPSQLHPQAPVGACTKTPEPPAWANQRRTYVHYRFGEEAKMFVYRLRGVFSRGLAGQPLVHLEDTTS